MLIFVINLPKDSVGECWRVEERCMMESLDDHHGSKCVYVHVCECVPACVCACVRACVCV